MKPDDVELEYKDQFKLFDSFAILIVFFIIFDIGYFLYFNINLIFNSKPIQEYSYLNIFLLSIVILISLGFLFYKKSQKYKEKWLSAESDRINRINNDPRW